MYAKKSLGQHFLKSEKALASIVAAGEMGPEDTALEIGPGKGALTEKLLACSLRLVAVEKDDDLYEQLKTKFQKEIGQGKLSLVHGDILEFDPASLQATSYKLIANIPYNITGAILKKFLGADEQPERMVLLVQKEVADRIVARDGKESILSISVKAYGKPRHVERVLAGSFAPAPKVDSAIVAITDISKEFFSHFDESAFFEMVRAGFKSKRKKLSSNLSELFDKKSVLEAFESLDLEENVRAENIPIETWKKLGERLL